MKRLFILLVLSALTFSLLFAGTKPKQKMVSRYNQITQTWADYPEVTIHDIQFVVPESLAAADGHQVNADVFSLNWKEQTSSRMGDTVVVVAQVVTPADPRRADSGSLHRPWGTMMLRDTVMAPPRGRPPGPHGGSAVRTVRSGSSRSFQQCRTWRVIRITGIVEEFRRPYEHDHAVASRQRHDVEILDSKPLSAADHRCSFYDGPFPGGPSHSTGNGGRCVHQNGEPYGNDNSEHSVAP